MLEIDGDDSSDGEDTNTQLEEYNLNDKHAEFRRSQNPTFYIKTNDPEAYSFLTYAIGVQLLYSPNVNAIYKTKKKTLGHTTLNANETMLKKWFLKTAEQAVHDVLFLKSQPAVAKHLANNFCAQKKTFLEKETNAWIKTRLRVFFKQLHSTDVLLETDDCLKCFQTKLESYIKNQDVKAEDFSAPPFFLPDDFEKKISSHINSFYKTAGLVHGNERFKKPTTRPTVTSQNPVKAIMIKEAENYTGNQYLSAITVETKKRVFKALLEKELTRGENAVVEKVDEQYRLKSGVSTETLEDDSTIGFLFSDDARTKYLPYDNERMIEELTLDIDLHFGNTFIRELQKLKKQMKIKLERVALPQQPTFVSTNIYEHLANLRLNVRDKRRRIRQAKDDEERENITSESFQAAWQMPTQKCLSLEKQEITSGCARTDIVINLETYKGIHTALNDFKVNINHDMKDRPKISDALVAAWVRDILLTGTPSTPRVKTKGLAELTTKFEDIPPRFQKTFLKFLVNLTYLLFGCEAQRNPSSLIIHQMMLELIEAKELTWTQAIANQALANNCGGGEMPMSMGKYVSGKNAKGGDIKVSSEPVSCARTLHRYYGLFALKPWRYDGKGTKDNSPDTQDFKHTCELVRRENAIVKKWFALKKLDDKPTEEKIQAIQTTIEEKWYPRPK